MKTKIVRIGNSRGIRIPKPLLEHAGLVDEVELRLVEAGIVVEGAARPRAGWAEVAAAVQARGEGGLLDEPAATDFDESGWAW